MYDTKRTARAAVFWFTALSVSALAQNTDPQQDKSWFFLQKVATDIRELWSCYAIALSQDDPDAKRFATAAYGKTTLFVHEIDAYIQSYASSRSKTETADAFRYRVWQVPIEVATRKARPMEELSPLLCSSMVP